MKRIRVLRRLRQTSQALFLVLFFYLLFMTRFKGSYTDLLSGPIRLDRPVRIFMEFDPLIALSTLLSTHSIYKGMLWALVVIAGTIILGRFFCGWVCPMGTLNHFTAFIFSGKKKKEKIRKNSTPRYQRGKYYILVGLLIMALLTSLQAGIMDPTSLLIRSMATAIFPALGVSLRALGALLRDTGVPSLQWLSGSIFYGLSGRGRGLPPGRRSF